MSNYRCYQLHLRSCSIKFESELYSVSNMTLNRVYVYFVQRVIIFIKYYVLILKKKQVKPSL